MTRIFLSLQKGPFSNLWLESWLWIVHSLVPGLPHTVHGPQVSDGIDHPKDGADPRHAPVHPHEGLKVKVLNGGKTVAQQKVAGHRQSCED